MMEPDIRATGDDYKNAAVHKFLPIRRLRLRKRRICYSLSSSLREIVPHNSKIGRVFLRVISAAEPQQMASITYIVDPEKSVSKQTSWRAGCEGEKVANVKRRPLNQKRDPQYPLTKLGEQIPWSISRPLGSITARTGRHAKPVRLITAKLLPPVTKNRLRVFQGRLR
jgi:hypothetical protein